MTGVLYQFGTHNGAPYYADMTQSVFLWWDSTPGDEAWRISVSLGGNIGAEDAHWAYAGDIGDPEGTYVADGIAQNNIDAAFAL